MYFKLAGLAFSTSFTLITAPLMAADATPCTVINGTVVCTSSADEFAGMTAGEKGKVVFDRTDEKHGPIMGYGSPGYGDSQATLRAITVDNSGNEYTRLMKVRYLEDTPEGNIRLVIFEKPNDMKRHALLTISHDEGLDEQWEYDPETRKIQRTHATNAFTPFSGTEISFEDFGTQDIDKYSYEYIGDDNLEGNNFYRVNRIPKSRYSGYSRLETWINQDNYLVEQVKYYDREGQLLKTLKLGEYQLFDDKYWRALSMTMENHKSQSTTQLEWSDFAFNTGLSKEDFSLTELRNVNP